MSDSRLPGLYFIWLYNQVCTVRDVDSPHSYTQVCEIMHEIPFKVLIAMDENRQGDAFELRNTFMKNRSGVVLYEREVSIFEVLVALAKRASVMVEQDMAMWFGIFLQNLKLDHLSDPYCYSLSASQRRIVSSLNRFNNRRYTARGSGGLFPLMRPLKDQRRVELWYQMGAYMNENRLY
jgi:hypothetical protein